MAGPYVPGATVYHFILDPRDGRTVYAAAPHGSEPWGPAVYRGRAGESLKATAHAPKFKDGSGLAVTRVWHLEPGPADEPETIYAGVEPAALFRSEDRGETWGDIDALNYHPTRKDWQPGFGGLCLHSVLVDPRKPRHLLAGISSVGTFESKDGGRTWTTENRGVRAEFMPNKYPEWGQCVHKLAWDGSGDGAIFQQNHCGTYHRGPDGGAWTEVTKGLPSEFGFPIAAHPEQKHTAFVTPLIGAENRVFPKGQMAVWKTTSSGKAWRSHTKGLPGPRATVRPDSEHEDQDQDGRQELRDSPHGRRPRVARGSVGPEEEGQRHEEAADPSKDQRRHDDRRGPSAAPRDGEDRCRDDPRQEREEAEDQDGHVLGRRPADVPESIAHSRHRATSPEDRGGVRKDQQEGDERDDQQEEAHEDVQVFEENGRTDEANDEEEDTRMGDHGPPDVGPIGPSGRV